MDDSGYVSINAKFTVKNPKGSVNSPIPIYMRHINILFTQEDLYKELNRIVNRIMLVILSTGTDNILMAACTKLKNKRKKIDDFLEKRKFPMKVFMNLYNIKKSNKLIPTEKMKFIGCSSANIEDVFL